MARPRRRVSKSRPLINVLLGVIIGVIIFAILGVLILIASLAGEAASTPATPPATVTPTGGAQVTVVPLGPLHPAAIALTRTAPLLAFYMMPLRAWQFAAGALVWLMFARTPPASRSVTRTAPGLGLLGLALIVACGLLLDAQRAYPGAWALLPTMGVVLVVLAGSLPGGQRGAGALLSLPPLQWLGRISYSWYLWHWPVLLLGVAYTGSQEPEYRALLVAVSLALAAGSHALVEAPLRRWRQWLAFPRTALLVSLVGMAAMAALATHWTRQASDALQTPALQRYAAARTDAPAIYAMGCDDWYRSATVRICSFGSEQAPRTAVLMGDSHVGQWFPAVRGALDAHWRVLVITKSSCPMVDEPFFYTRIGREYTECAQWRDAALRQVLAEHGLPDVRVERLVDRQRVAVLLARRAQRVECRVRRGLLLRVAVVPGELAQRGIVGIGIGVYFWWRLCVV